MRKAVRKTKKTVVKTSSSTRDISARNKILNSDNFLVTHWELAHALLNGEVAPEVANAFATQTARIIGFKKLEIDRARLIGEKLSGNILGTTRK